jgi:hypothetical protein
VTGQVLDGVQTRRGELVQRPALDRLAVNRQPGSTVKVADAVCDGREAAPAPWLGAHRDAQRPFDLDPAHSVRVQVALITRLLVIIVISVLRNASATIIPAWRRRCRSSARSR